MRARRSPNTRVTRKGRHAASVDVVEADAANAAEVPCTDFDALVYGSGSERPTHQDTFPTRRTPRATVGETSSAISA